MDYQNDLWEILPEEHSMCYLGIYQQPESLLQRACNLQNQLLAKIYHQHIDLNYKSANMQTENQAQGMQPVARSQRHQKPRIRQINSSSEEQYMKKKKTIKPSPYHNYQKHLNTTLKHLLVFPSIEPEAPISVTVAHQLWKAFLQNQSPTKKILHFIFNEFNQYRIKPNDLKDLGFQEIYGEHSKKLLGEAKAYLSNMAMNQLNEENIEAYLETRRIKNAQKFKKYLLVFRQELQDGFLKKRFTNLSRKQQMRREFTECSS